MCDKLMVDLQEQQGLLSLRRLLEIPTCSGLYKLFSLSKKHTRTTMGPYGLEYCAALIVLSCVFTAAIAEEERREVSSVYYRINK